MEVFGEETWFRVGDRDAATHVTRTNMLKNGKNLSDITQWMCEKFAVESKVIPITDNTVETRITSNGEDLHLQEFWVKHRGRGNIEGIQYVGADKARPNPDAISAIQDAELVVIAPGNPLTSIGPMMGIKGVRKELTKNKKKVVSVSPLIGNKSFSGPADKYMEAAGIEVSVFGLAQMYADVCSKMVIDTKDKAQASKIQGLDIQVFDTKIKMQNKMAEEALAGFILKQLKLQLKTSVIIPVKSFQKSKTRLQLSEEKTIELCRLLLREVIKTVSESGSIDKIIVVSNEDDFYYFIY